MQEMLEIGIIGTAVYGAFLIVCLYRTYRYWEVTKGERDLKFRFHVLLLANVCLELAYFISFIMEKRYSMWGYQFHLYSLLFHVLSYSAVLVLWAKALTVSNHAYNVLWRFILCLAVGFGCATLVNSGYLFYADNFDRYLEGSPEVYTTLWVSETLILLVFTLWMLVYVLRVKQEVKANFDQNLADIDARRSLWRINTVVAACVLAALLRLLALCFLIVISNFEFPELQWFIYSNWIPTIIPCTVLLFVTRPNPNVGEEETNDDKYYNENYSTDGTSVMSGPNGSQVYSSDGERPKSVLHSGDDPRSSRFSSTIDQRLSTGDDPIFSSKALTFLRDTQFNVAGDSRADPNRSSRHSRRIEFDGQKSGQTQTNPMLLRGVNPMYNAGEGVGESL